MQACGDIRRCGVMHCGGVEIPATEESKVMTAALRRRGWDDGGAIGKFPEQDNVDDVE